MRVVPPGAGGVPVVVLQVAVGWPGVRFGEPWRRAIRPPTASLSYLAGWAARTTPEVLPTWGDSERRVKQRQVGAPLPAA